MKLTKTKLNQLIREVLAETKGSSWDIGPPPDTSTPSGQADYQEWERDARAAEQQVSEQGIQLHLTYDEYDLVTAALNYAAHYHPFPEDQLHTGPKAEDVWRIIDDEWGEVEGADDPIELTELAKL